MVRQNDNGLNVKWVLLLDRMQRLPKELHGFGMLEEVLTVVGDDGEEVGCSWRFGTAVVHDDVRLIRTFRIDRWCRNRTYVCWVF